MRKITSFEEAAIANKEITDKLTAIEKKLDGALANNQDSHNRFQAIVSSQVRNNTTNDLVFTWTGGANTLTWNGGSLQDTQQKSHVIPAGSLTLTPSTYYWLFWNKQHNQVVATTGISTSLYSNENTQIICQIYTGTNVQSGVAGGGGSTSSRDLSGARYKNF